MEKEKINSMSWRDPENGDERISITKLIVQNQIKICSEFQIKKIGINEYILACNHGGQNWNYFHISIPGEKLKRLDNDFVSKLHPPR